MKAVQVHVSAEEGKKEMEMMHIFKMNVKIMVVVVVTAIATPYFFGFAGTLFNSLETGCKDGLWVVCIGLFTIDYIIINGIRRVFDGTANQGGGTKCDEP